jgi:hypothetical protein
MGGSVIHSLIYIRGRLHVDYYGSSLTSGSSTVVVVGCSVATSNNALVRGIRGCFRPRHVGLVRRVPSVSPGYSWAAAPEMIRAVA